MVYEGVLIHSMIFHFFHTFSSISRDNIYIVTLNEIHHYIWNFMRYKMIFFCAINLRLKIFVFRHFTNIFVNYARNMRSNYHKVHHDNQFTELFLMICISPTVLQKTHTHTLNYSKYYSRC